MPGRGVGLQSETRAETPNRADSELEYMKKNTAWLLAVVSDVGQAESLPHQQKWATDTCAANGWSVTREFAKAGSSGKEGVRALVETMLAALRASAPTSRPERILMIRQDRLGRGSGNDTMGALAEIYELGTVVHTREDGDIKLSRVADSILPFFRAMTAGLENEVKIDKS